MSVFELVKLFTPDTSITICNSADDKLLWGGYVQNYNYANGLSERYSVRSIEAVGDEAIIINVIDTLEEN